ncbi:RNA polymerase III subunit RPC82 helix-turn-helix domain-containing protein [Ceratobasidium sp. AG-Ba]|nr:RNA polymerase III subunit RPC82 helix-turn-helix domain-containing protein [Ceratobasidium sp. AG-Ba]
MSVNVGDAAILDAAHAADSEYILRQFSTRGYQAFSFITPLAYTGYALAKRKQWSLGQTLRATWIGGIGGAVAGAGTGWAWTSSVSPERVRATRIKMAYDRNLLRLNDHSTIGLLLGGLLTPAIFLKRGRLIDLVLGGAGIGSSVGAGAHFWRSFTEPGLPVGPGPAVPPPS